jgi:hypothetical protein
MQWADGRFRGTSLVRGTDGGTRRLDNANRAIEDQSQRPVGSPARASSGGTAHLSYRGRSCGPGRGVLPADELWSIRSLCRGSRLLSTVCVVTTMPESARRSPRRLSTDTLAALGAYAELPTEAQLAATELAERRTALVARLSNVLYSCAVAHGRSLLTAAGIYLIRWAVSPTTDADPSPINWHQTRSGDCIFFRLASGIMVGRSRRQRCP